LLSAGACGPQQVSFDSGNGLDTTAPLLSGIAASMVTESIAVVTWSTDELAISHVEYGPTIDYGDATPLYGLALHHRVVLTGLEAGVSYHFRVESRDEAGNLATSDDFTFDASNQPPVVVDGLVGHWTFDDVSGDVAPDTSPNGFDGSLVNAPSPVSGAIGEALAFDGASSYVAVPHSAALDAFPLTVALWLQTSSTSGVGGIVNKYVAASFNGYQVFSNAGNLCACGPL